MAPRITFESGMVRLTVMVRFSMETDKHRCSAKVGRRKVVVLGLGYELLRTLLCMRFCVRANPSHSRMCSERLNM